MGGPLDVLLNLGRNLRLEAVLPFEHSRNRTLMVKMFDLNKRSIGEQVDVPLPPFVGAASYG